MLPYIKQEDLDNWFMYHSPTSEQQEKYLSVREGAKKFAELLVSLCPDCPDTTTAIRHLRETVMIANQAIACYS